MIHASVGPACRLAVKAVALGAALLLFLALHRNYGTDSLYLPIQFQGSTPASGSTPWCPAADTGSYPATPFPISFWFVKTPKTGGTTLAGVLRTICAHTGVMALKWHMATESLSLQQLDTYVQAAYNLSDTASVAILSHLRYAEAKAALLKPPLLMFTAVRHPVARMHSGFVQHLCIQTAKQQGRSPNECDSNATFMQQALQQDTLEQRWAYARGRQQQNELFKYIQGSGKKTVQEAAGIYDFIFVSERMNEALVVFMLEYGLRFADIAYLSSKNRTGKYRTASALPQELNDYIASSNSLDLELWQLANRQLDRRVTSLEQRCGTGVVASALATFEQLLDEVRKECGDYVSWYKAHGFGEPYSYEGDRGLGHRCVSYVVWRRRQ